MNLDSLPASWQAHVQAACLQAVALAHRGMCVARGWAADSPRQRVRLRFEVERLAAEVGLLTEELRIKDARLARIPPPQRPHYPPADRSPSSEEGRRRGAARHGAGGDRHRLAMVATATTSGLLGPPTTTAMARRVPGVIAWALPDAYLPARRI